MRKTALLSTHNYRGRVIPDSADDEFPRYGPITANELRNATVDDTDVVRRFSLFGLQPLAYSVLPSAFLALFRVQHPWSNLHPSRLRSAMCRLQLRQGEGEVLRPHLHQHAYRQDHVESSPVGLLVRTM